MSTQSSVWRRMLPAVILAAGLLQFTGCLDDDRIDHKPPTDNGSLVVDNLSASDINVFINGEQRERVRSGRWRAYDLEPGVYRLVLDEQDGERNYRDDIDVLDGRLTVVETSYDPGNRNRFRAFTYFD